MQVKNQKASSPNVTKQIKSNQNLNISSQNFALAYENLKNKQKNLPTILSNPIRKIQLQEFDDVDSGLSNFNSKKISPTEDDEDFLTAPDELQVENAVRDWHIAHSNDYEN